MQILSENNFSSDDCIIIVRTFLYKSKRILYLSKESRHFSPKSPNGHYRDFTTKKRHHASIHTNAQQRQTQMPRPRNDVLFFWPAEDTMLE